MLGLLRYKETPVSDLIPMALSSSRERAIRESPHAIEWVIGWQFRRGELYESRKQVHGHHGLSNGFPGFDYTGPGGDKGTLWPPSFTLSLRPRTSDGLGGAKAGKHLELSLYPKTPKGKCA